VLPAETILPYLEARRADLLRFATMQLGDPSLAEDAVQEAMLAALSNHASFQQRAQLKT